MIIDEKTKNLKKTAAGGEIYAWGRITVGGRIAAGRWIRIEGDRKNEI